MNGVRRPLSASGLFQAPLAAIDRVGDGLFPSGVQSAGDWIMGSAYAGGPAGGGVIFRFKRD